MARQSDSPVDAGLLLLEGALEALERGGSPVALRTAEGLLGKRGLARDEAIRQLREALKGRRKQPVTAPASVATDSRFDETKHPRAKGGAGGGRFIAKGETSTRVTAAQNRLTALGHPTKPDGQFGPRTEGSVKAFQKTHGLPQTGHIDATTLELMRNPPPIAFATAQAQMNVAISEAGGTLARGSRGPKVEKVQSALGRLGYAITDDPGSYGAETERAVRELQKANGFAATGKADAQTMALMTRLEREAASASTGNLSGDESGTWATGGSRARPRLRQAEEELMTANERQLEEYSRGGNPTVPNSPGSMEVFAWGGAVPLLAAGATAAGGEEPPGLRDAGENDFAACASCVFWTADFVCQRFSWRTERDEVCDDWRTVTPGKDKGSRLQEALADVEEGVVGFVHHVYDETKHPRGRGGEWRDVPGKGDDAPKAKGRGIKQHPRSARRELERKLDKLDVDARVRRARKGKLNPAAGEEWSDKLAALKVGEKLELRGGVLVERTDEGFNMRMRDPYEEYGSRETGFTHKTAEDAAQAARRVDEVGTGSMEMPSRYAYEMAIIGPDEERRLADAMRARREAREAKTGKANPPAGPDSGRYLGDVKLKDMTDSELSAHIGYLMDLSGKRAGAKLSDAVAEEERRKAAKASPGKGRPNSAKVEKAYKEHIAAGRGVVIESGPAAKKTYRAHTPDGKASNQSISPEAGKEWLRDQGIGDIAIVYRDGTSEVEGDLFDVHQKLRHGTAAEKKAATLEVDKRFKKLKESRVGAVLGELEEVSSRVYPGLDRSPKENWVDKTGGLPSYIERIAKHLHYEKGKTIGTAIAIAVNTVKRWCAGGGPTTHGGTVSHVSPDTKAKACRAVAEWEAKKAASHAKTAAKAVAEGGWPETFGDALALFEADFKPIPPSMNFCAKLLVDVEAAYDDWDEFVDGFSPALLEAEWVDEDAFVEESVLDALRLARRAAALRWSPKQHPRGRTGEFVDVLDKLGHAAKREPGSRSRHRGKANPAAGAHHPALQAALDKFAKGGWRFEPRHAWTLGKSMEDAVDVSHGGTEYHFDKAKDGKWRLSGVSVMGHRQGIGHGFSSGFEGAANEDASGVHVTDDDLLAKLEAAALPKAGKANPAADDDAAITRSLERTSEHNRGYEDRAAGRKPTPTKGKSEDAYMSGYEAASPEERAAWNSGEWSRAYKVTPKGKENPSADDLRALWKDYKAREAAPRAPGHRIDPRARGRAAPSLGGLPFQDEHLSGVDIPDWVHAMEGTPRPRGKAAPPVATLEPAEELTVDKAIGETLQKFEGVTDWHLEGPTTAMNGKKAWHVHVTLDDGKKHVIRVWEDGTVEDASVPGFSLPAPAAVLSAKPEAPAEGLSLSDLAPTGTEEKPFHMPDGTYFYGKDGKLYRKVTNTKMMGKKGPLAAVEIENVTDGTSKVAPAFALQTYYEMLGPKGAPKPAAPTPTALYDQLAASIGSSDVPKSVSGLHVVVTGKIEGKTRDEVFALLSAAGATPQKSVTGQTQLLITGEHVGATKINAAKKKGVKVVSYDDIAGLIEAAVGPNRVKLIAVRARLEEASDPSEITRLRARETVLVRRVLDDHAAAHALYEASFTAAQRRELEDKGQTMAGGRYPIRNGRDLHNAFMDWIRTGKPSDVAAWIGKRAKELGLPNPITA